MKRTIANTAKMAMLAGTVALPLIAASSGAEAQSRRVCTVLDTLSEHLERKYQEHVTAAGVDGGGNLIQVFSSDNGTWTIAITIPNGPTCIVSSGEGWTRPQIAEAKIQDEES